MHHPAVPLPHLTAGIRYRRDSRMHTHTEIKGIYVILGIRIEHKTCFACSMQSGHAICWSLLQTVTYHPAHPLFQHCRRRPFLHRRCNLDVQNVLPLFQKPSGVPGQCAYKIYRQYGDVSRDRHFGGLITLDSPGWTNRKQKHICILVQAGYTIRIRVIEYTCPQALPSVVYIQ